MAPSRFPIARCAWAGRVILATLLVIFCCVATASSASAQTVVSLTFDDGIQTQLGAASVLESHGMRGTFYINSGTVGSKDFFMSWPQVDALATTGHEIGGHTVDHQRLTTLTTAQQRQEVCNDATTLRGRGYAVTDFAYPYGAGSVEPGVLSALSDCGYLTARKVGEIRGDTGCDNCPAADTLPPGNRYGMRSTPVTLGPITLSMLEGWVTQAEAGGGGILPIVFHSICDNCEDASVSISDFTAFIDWLSARSVIGTVVKPVNRALAEGPQHPPATTSITCNGGPCGTTPFKAPVSLALAATDGGGGVGATRYSLDGSDPTPSSTAYAGPFSVSATTVVKFRTWDLADNPEPVRTQVVNVDAVAPTVQVTSPADGTAMRPGAATVKVDAADVGSGVGEVQLFVDGDYVDSVYGPSSPYQFTVPATMLALGSHKVKATAIDVAGNKTSSAIVTIPVTDGLPTTTISCDGGACPANFVKGPLSVTLSATDGGAGLGATRYTLDGSDPSDTSPQYGGPFTLTDSAVVKFRTWDSTGNPEQVRTQTLKIDATAPTAQIVSPASGTDLLSRNDTTVKIDAADSGVGIDSVELFVDGDYYDYSRSSATPYEVTVPAGALALGAHRLRAIVTDKLGNRFTTSIVNLAVKDGLPTTSIACDGGACPANFVKGPVSVAFSATDGGGGLGATRYTLDGSDPTATSPPYSAPLSLTDSTTIKFRSWDATGNPEAVQTQVLKVDAVAPTAQITAPADAASLLSRNAVAVSVDATDLGSGIADVQLLVDGDYLDYSRSTGSPYQFLLAPGTLGLGTHRLKALVTDKLGNSSSSTVNVTIKDGLPTTTMSCDGGACPTGFVKGPVSFALSASDGGGGLGATRFTFDGSDPTDTSPQYNGPFTLTETTTVNFRTWDASGNPEPVRSQTVKLDAAAPIAQIASPANGDSVVQAPITVKVDASDPGSGISDVQLFIDGDYYDYSRSTSSPYEFKLPVDTLPVGTHRLKALVTDKLGNATSTGVVNLTIKDGLPTTTISCDGGACPAGFVKGPVSVALSPTDGGAGVGATRYTLDGSDPTASSPQYSGPLTLTDSATVKFRSWDSFGHAEAVRSQALKIDGAAPTAQISSPADNAALLARNDVPVTVDAADPGSGVSEVQLFVDGNYYGLVKNAPYAFTLPAGTLSAGSHRLKALVLDAIGNSANTSVVTVTVKDGLPATSIACDGGACPAGFVKGPVSVALSAADGGAGVGATRYTLDGSDPTPSSPQYNGPFTLTDTTTVKFRTWDLAGNAEPVGTQTIKLDPVAPTAQISSPADASNLLSHDDVTVKVDASDTGSGVADVQLFVDGNYTSSLKSAPYDFTLPKGTLDLGAHKLKALVSDAIGNSASSSVVAVTVRDGLPTTTIVCDGGACPAGFVKGPVSVALSAADGGGGLGATRYTTDGSDPTDSSPQYNGPFSLTDTTTVKFRSWDAAGNAEAVRSQTLKIDAAAPTAQITSPADGGGLLQRNDVSVKVDAADTGSGIKDVQLFVDGNYVNSLKSSPYDFMLPAGTLSLGAHRLKALVTDALDNSASSAIVNVTVKDGLSSTAIACDGGACPAGFVKGPVSVALSATDGGGGLGATRFTLDGSDPAATSPQYNGPLTLTDTTTVKYRTWDSAGNAEPVQSQTLKIDAVAPTAQISAPGDGTTLTMHDVNVNVDAADAGSGIADVQLFVDGNYTASSSSLGSPYQFTLAAGTLALGPHKLKALVTDKLGNGTPTAIVNFTLADGLPTTTISCDGAACPANFVKGPVSVSLHATDNGGGLGATRYALDGSDPTTTSTAYTGAFQISDLTTVKFRSWDSAGNPEPVRSETIKADSTAPTSQIATPTDGTSMLMGNLTVKVNATDASSGVSEVELFADGDYLDWARGKTSPYEFTIAAGTLPLGTHKLKAFATDGLGNRTSSAPVTVTLTDGLPNTTASCGGAPCPTGFAKGPVSVALAAADGGGGLGATRYTLDGSDPTPSSPQYTAPLTLTDTTTVKFRTWDLAGNAEPVRTQTIKLDAIPPTAQIVSPADGASLLKGDVTVKVDAADTGSGVSDVELYLDGDYFDYARTKTSPYEFKLPAASLALGTHRLKVVVTDNLGNQTTAAPVTFSLNDGLPATKIACDGAPCVSGWQKGPVSASLSATDAGGGLGATRYTLDGSDPTSSSQQYDAPFTLTGTTTVKYRTWDTAGNAEPVKTQTIKLDAAAPTAQILSPADGASLLAGDLTVKVDAADAGSGVSDVELYLDGDYAGYSKSKSSPYEVTLPAASLALGTHKLKAVVTDSLGNHTTAGPVTFSVNDGLPATKIACDGAPCSNDWSKGPVTVTMSATDGGGGLGVTRYTVDGSDPNTGSTEYTGAFNLSGTTTVKYRTWDLAGKAEAVKTQTIKLDAAAPTAQIASPTDGAKLPNGAVTMQVDAADAGSGVSDVELYVDGDYTGYSKSKSSPYDIALPAGALGLGSHHAKVVVTDGTGNHVTSAPVTFTINDGLPVTTIACDGAPCSGNWSKGPVTVNLSATDGGGGLAATRYTLDGSDPTPASPEYSGPLTLTDTTTLKFRTWDLAGNAEPVKTQTIKLDSVAPTASIASPANGTNLNTGDVTVKVDAADAGSGIDSVELYLDGDYLGYSKSKSSPYDITIPGAALPLGQHTVKALVTDALGSHVSTAPVAFSVKDGLPTTKIACDGSACSSDWSKGPVSVTLSATDGGGGLAATRYTVDGSDPTTSSTEYSGAFNVSETTTVKFRTWDTAGNAEGVKSETIKVDAVAPTAQITTPAAGASLRGDVTVHVDAADPGSGIQDVELLADGNYLGASKSKSSPYDFTLAAGTLDAGAHTLKAVATDALGNKVTSDPVAFTLKDGLPTTAIACDGAPCSNDWSKGPVAVTLSATDGGTGVDKTRYTLDGTDPTTSSPEYTGAFNLSETTTVKFRTWNTAGDAEPVRTEHIKVDAVAPTADITSPADGASVKGDITVKVGATDAGSGIADVELLADGDSLGASKSKSSPYEFTIPAGTLSLGTHKLKAIATDALGNRTNSSVVTIDVQDVLPTTTIKCDGLSCPAEFVKGPVNAALTAIDAGSGLGATRYTLDGSAPDTSSTEYTGPFALSGTTTVKFRTWDSAGNAEQVRTQTIKIDSTSPTAQIVSPAEGDHVTGDVNVKVDAADAGAGVSDVALFVDGDYVGSSGGSSSPYEILWHAGIFTSGSHTLKAVAADALGNKVSTTPVTVTVDAPPAPPGPPTTTISCDGLGCSSDYVKGPVTVKLAAIDAGTGVGATRYTLDGSTPDAGSTEYTGPFTVSATTTVKFRSWDSADNPGPVGSHTIEIDTTAPTAQIVSPVYGAHLTGDILVKVDAADSGAGVSTVDLFVDGDYVGFSHSTVSPYDITIPAGTLAPGSHELKAQVADTLGNLVATDPITVMVG